MTDDARERFEAFVRTHQDMVYATARRLLRSAPEAEDVAQDVFLKAFERFDALAGHPSAAAWLRTVTRNACLNHLSRYRSRWRFFSELRRPVESDEPYEDTLAAPDTGGGAAIGERLERALERLPDAQRVPLVPFHCEEMSYQQIAEALGISLAKVKTDMHRGREALRRALAGADGSR